MITRLDQQKKLMNNAITVQKYDSGTEYNSARGASKQIDRKAEANMDLKVFEIKDRSKNLSPGGTYKIDQLLNESKVQKVSQLVFNESDAYAHKTLKNKSLNDTKTTINTVNTAHKTMRTTLNESQLHNRNRN